MADIAGQNVLITGALRGVATIVERLVQRK